MRLYGWTAVWAAKQQLRAPVIAMLVETAAGVALYVSLYHETAAPQVTFVVLQGERISTDSLRGKVVLVNCGAGVQKSSGRRILPGCVNPWQRSCQQQFARREKLWQFPGDKITKNGAT